MGRNYNINGPAMVSVLGGRHLKLLGGDLGLLGSVAPVELGLSAGDVRVEPRFYHRDIHVDAFGDKVPAEVEWKLADVSISAKLIHYDPQVLDVCLTEAMGGGGFAVGQEWRPGIMGPAGTMLGKNKELFASGCHYMALVIASPYQQRPQYFPTCYLSERPLILPVGTNVTAAEVNWRYIPYAPQPGTSSPTGSTTPSTDSSTTGGGWQIPPPGQLELFDPIPAPEEYTWPDLLNPFEP